MKTMIHSLCLIGGFFSLVSSLPIPGEHYILSDIQATVPMTTGMGVAIGARQGAGLGPQGMVTGAAIGGLGGAAVGAVTGAILGTFEQGTRSDLGKSYKLALTCLGVANNQDCRKERIPFWVGTGLGAAYAGGLLRSLKALPLAAGTSLAVEGAMRAVDPYAGICERPD